MPVIAPKTWYTYTYAYPDGTVFYVGKGTGNRVNAHENEARWGCGCDKCVVIRKIWSDGENVEKSIVEQGLTEKDALQQEKVLISRYSGKSLTNERSNPDKKKSLQIFIPVVPFPEKVIAGTSYVAVTDLPKSFGVSKHRMDLYLSYLDITRHLFPHSRQSYILKSDSDRVLAFMKTLG